MLGKKKQEINYLNLTPVSNYSYEIKNNGLVDVLVPKFTDRFLGKFLQPKLRKGYIRANLDELGSAVWQLIDGSKKVSEIAKELDVRFGAKISPVHDRLTAFLTQLYNAGFISFIEFKKG